MQNLITLLLTLAKRYWDKAAGKKTYVVVTSGLIGAVLLYLSGGMELAAVVSVVTVLLSQMTQRHGAATEAKKAAESPTMRLGYGKTNTPLRSAEDAAYPHTKS